MEAELAQLRNRLQQADAAAHSKDAELAATMQRATKLENKQYGLPEAVREIKDLRQQVLHDV